MLAHAYNSIIDRGVGSTGHGRYVVDGLNVTDNFFLYILMITVKLPGAASYDS